MEDIKADVEGLQKVSGYFKSMLKVGYDGDSDIYTQHREAVKKAIELLKEQQHEIWELQELNEHLTDQQPKTARWEKRTGMMPPEYHGHYWCSNCDWHGRYNEREADYKYCPACGAKMEKQP